MNFRSAWKLSVLAPLSVILVAVSGCTVSHLPDAAICPPVVAPILNDPSASPSRLPEPPSAPSIELVKPPAAEPKRAEDLPRQPGSNNQELGPPKAADQFAGVLELWEVLRSVDQNFPLLLAIEQERNIAAGQRLASEGAFDLNLRIRGTTQGGTFPGNRFDLIGEQPTALHGLTFFSGYRFGYGDYPVYYGDRLTADGGEFRAGAVLPLLKDGAIDRRRASLLQAQIAESLADPVIQRSRIDYFRSAARAYWNWVAAGELYRVASALLSIAKDRQAGFEEQFKTGQISEFVVVDNRRLIAEREGTLIAAGRRFQQTSFDLSLFLRDPAGNPLIPAANRLPASFADQDPSQPATEQLGSDIETAYVRRPELVRFALLKKRAAVDLRLAENQTLPSLNATVSGSQDVGDGKDSPGIFALDRSVAEASLLLEVPLQRREAEGRTRAAQALLAQLLAQERFARDQISAEVQDAVSNKDRTYQRLQRAREELRIALRVAEMEEERFRKGQSNLLEVNLREISAAGAKAKVIETLAEYFRADAEYRAALGLDAIDQAQ